MENLGLSRKIMMGFLISYCVTWASYIGIYLFVFPNSVTYKLCIFPGLTLSLFALYLAYKNREKVAGIIANFSTTATLLAIAGYTGQIYSTVPIYITLTIVATFLLNGYKVGIFAASYSMIGLILSFIFLNEYSFEFAIDSTEFIVFTTINYLNGFFLIGVCSYIFSGTTYKAILEANRQRNLHGKQARNTKAILDSIQQAVFSITDREGQLIIGDDFSKKIGNFFENCNIGGQDPIKAIFSKMNFSHENLSNINTLLTTSIGSDCFQFDANSHTVPTEAYFNNKYVKVNWAYVENEIGDIEKVLVTLQDVTNEKILEKVRIEKEREIERLIAIASISEKQFSRFIISSEKLLDDCFFILKKSHSNSVIAEIIRSLHTIKGIARTYQFIEISSAVHDLEHFLQNLKDKQDETSIGIDDQLKRLRGLLGVYRQIATEKLGISFEDKRITVEVSVLDDVYNSVLNQAKNLKNRAETDQIVSSLIKLKETYSVRLQDILREQIKGADKYCRDHGKGNLQVVFGGDQYFIARDYISLFEGLFIHLFRNSIDHGLVIGKSAEISIWSQVHQDSLEIRFKDNGQGIHLEKLKSKGVEKKLLDPTEMRPQVIAELVFASGLSTADKITDISGRGAGLDFVRSSIEEKNGKIDIEILSIINQYAIFEFKLRLPIQSLDSPAQFLDKVA